MVFNVESLLSTLIGKANSITMDITYAVYKNKKTLKVAARLFTKDY